MEFFGLPVKLCHSFSVLFCLLLLNVVVLCNLQIVVHLTKLFACMLQHDTDILGILPHLSVQALYLPLNRPRSHCLCGKVLLLLFSRRRSSRTLRALPGGRNIVRCDPRVPRTQACKPRSEICFGCLLFVPAQTSLAPRQSMVD